jgi:hypothetical protein
MDNYLSPRMQGAYEQYRRAKHFLRLARHCKKPISKFTNLITAVYPSRAIVEIIIEAVKKKEFPNIKNREEIEKIIIPKLPYYKLIYRIRIHDFHRFGCLPPSPEHKTVFYGGTIMLTTNKGKKAIAGDRPLITKDGIYFSIGKKFIPLDKILNDFLEAVPEVLAEIKKYN